MKKIKIILISPQRLNEDQRKLLDKVFKDWTLHRYIKERVNGPQVKQIALNYPDAIFIVDLSPLLIRRLLNTKVKVYMFEEKEKPVKQHWAKQILQKFNKNNPYKLVEITDIKLDPYYRGMFIIEKKEVK